MTGRPVAEDVSVVVPTVGRPLVEGCLGSIADGMVWPAELIVVDQGTKPDVAKWIDRLRGGAADRTVGEPAREAAHRGRAGAAGALVEEVHQVRPVAVSQGPGGPAFRPGVIPGPVG